MEKSNEKNCKTPALAILIACLIFTIAFILMCVMIQRAHKYNHLECSCQKVLEHSTRIAYSRQTKRICLLLSNKTISADQIKPVYLPCPTPGIENPFAGIANSTTKKPSTPVSVPTVDHPDHDDKESISVFHP